MHVVVRRSHRLWILPRRPQSSRGGPDCRTRLPTVVAMSTAAPPSEITEEALAVLRELTGRPDAVFREGQDAAVSALVERSQRALVVQRTGWGKSAVYFVSTALLRRRGAGPTLLVSPLLALMRDQVAAAARAGIRAVEISSANMTEWDDIAARLAADDVDVLLVSPERLTNPRFREEQLPGLVARCGLRGRRRGALRLRLGPRLPPRLPPHPRPARHPAGRDAGARHHRDGERARRRRRRRAAGRRRRGGDDGARAALPRLAAARRAPAAVATAPGWPGCRRTSATCRAAASSTRSPSPRPRRRPRCCATPATRCAPTPAGSTTPTARTPRRRCATTR